MIGSPSFAAVCVCCVDPRDHQSHPEAASPRDDRRAGCQLTTLRPRHGKSPRMQSLSSRSTTTPPQNLMGARGAHRVHRTAHRSGAESGDCCAVVPVDVGETRTSPHDCFSCPLYFFLGPFFVSVVGGSVLLCPSSARTACPAACQFSLCIYPDILLMSIEDGGESIGHASRLVWQCGANSPSLGVIHLGKGFVLGGQLMMSLSPT